MCPNCEEPYLPVNSEDNICDDCANAHCSEFGIFYDLDWELQEEDGADGWLSSSGYGDY